MSYKEHHTALAWANAKTAAVYFDSVIPANITDTYRSDAEDPIYYEVLQNILPETLRDATAKTGLSEPVMAYVTNCLVAFPQAVGADKLPGNETFEERADAELSYWLGAFSDLIASASVPDIAIYGVDLLQPARDKTGDPALILSNLDLVDVTLLPWRQVLELRRDTNSVENLRNLRRLVYKDYTGKSEAYIRDDIEFRLAEYNEATKIWDLPLKKGVLEIP